MSDYRVKKGLLGSSILYDCPNCGAPLTSSIAKAGSTDTCPDCARKFTVPGMEELKRAKEQKEQKIEKPKIPEPPKLVPPSASGAKPATANATAPEFVEAPDFVEVKPRINQPDAAPIDPPVRPPPKKPRPAIHQFGDSLLELAFTAARVFSVFVIIGCSVAMAIIGTLALSAVSNYREVNAEPLRTPSRAELNSSLERIRSTVKEESDRGNATPKPLESADPVDILLAKHHLKSSYLDTDIYSVRSELNDSDFRAFLRELGELLETVKQDEKSWAVTWYCMQYKANIAAYDSDIEEDELNNAQVTTRLMVFLWAGMVTFLGLMAFIAFPLLIRIEANTRPTVRSVG